MNPTDLLVLIKLLKAEGVKEYEGNGTRLVFDTTLGPAVAVSLPELVVEEVAPVELPPALKRLNPNYLKLSGVVKRG